MEKANAIFTKPVYFSNISQIGLHANRNSNVYHYGPTQGTTYSGTGSFMVNNAIIGVQAANNSSLDCTNARMSNVRYGLVGVKNSSAKITNSIIQAKGTTGFEMVGVYADSLAVVSAFNVSCTGFGSGTSPTGNSQYRIFNKALLFVESATAQSVVANGTSSSGQDGTVVVDVTRGAGVLELLSGQSSYASGSSSTPVGD